MILERENLLPSYETLTTNERIGIAAIEITAIPHVSTLQQRSAETASITTEYKEDMGRLLAEVYQLYRDFAVGGCADVALEILWSTREVKNQPYKAAITLHLIIRAIGESDTVIGESISSLMRICKATLDFGKYEYREVSIDELTSQVKAINAGAVKAVVKSEELANLQNHYLPFCFTYDRLPVTENDMSRIVSSLINHADCAVSFQLIPMSLSPEEAAAIDGNTQMLDTLTKGISEQGSGNISFTLAERHAETYKYYSYHKNNALFGFNILVYGSENAAAIIAARILTQLNNSGELRSISLSSSDVAKDANFYPLPWAVHELILATDRKPSIWHTGQGQKAFYGLPYIITAEEAAEFFRLPIGSDAIHAGLNVNETGKTSRTYAANVVGGGDITVGMLKSSSQGDSIGLSLNDLTKHMLVVGTPGSGKTTFSVSLLDRLWKNHGIPFLVIEPAKNEYRALVQSIPDLQVFTPGKNFISPFIFNPFIPPRNVKLETYKSTLKTAFAAAVSMSSPLDKIFEETVNNCYSDFRWLDSYTSDDKGKIFNIADFLHCFEKTFAEIGYSGDAQNIGRAGVVRLKSLMNLFDNYHSVPLEDLLTKPTVIELAAIENSDQKALIIALLLLSVLAYVNSNYLGEGSLKNVILLEEAHVLLDADANKGEGEANPSAIAQGLVKRMLAEIRSYGVGIVIADQSPRKVTTDVVALTDIKLAFRLVEATDRQIITDSANMDETKKQRLSRLRPGEAFLFFGKLDEPEEIKTEDYRMAQNINITLSDEGIKSLSTYWDNRREQLRPYPECEYSCFCVEDCDYHKRILGREIARRIYYKYFRPHSSEIEQVKRVFSQMKELIMFELNDEQYDSHLLACVEMHLFRKIKYETRINISDATVMVTLSNIKGDV
ncbi:MAG: ATP-binding protein [Lachnospiraceae bacterium]|nr:ATP-binding protein [Lachnospiraceae bacterium]